MDFWSLWWSIQNGRYLAITYLTCYGAQNENILILDYLSSNCYCQGLRWYSRSWNSRRFSSVVLNNSLLQASLRTLFGNIKVQLFFVYNFRRLEKLSVTVNFVFALVLFYYFKRMRKGTWQLTCTVKYVLTFNYYNFNCKLATTR